MLTKTGVIIKAFMQHKFYLTSKLYLDGAFSVASLICVPSLIVATVFWMSSPPSNVRVSNPDPNKITAKQGSTTHIEPKINMQVSGPKVVYRLQLVDSKGEVKFNYPANTVSEDKLQLDTVNVKLPDTIVPGEYSLVADIKYLGNPIQTNTVQLDLAHISVGSKTN